MLIPMPLQNYANHALQAISSNALDIQTFINDHQTLCIGISTYAIGLYVLNNVEQNMISQGKSTIFSNKKSFSDREKELSWITPVFTTRPFPSLKELEKQPQYLGSCDMISQYITMKKIKYIEGLQEFSEEWSNFYDIDVYIYKEKSSI